MKLEQLDGDHMETATEVDAVATRYTGAMGGPELCDTLDRAG